MAVHSFKARRGYSSYHGPCGECGYTKGNEQQHGHSCTGKVILDHNSETRMHCYECGRRTPTTPCR
jgi:hypothetical protein